MAAVRARITPKSSSLRSAYTRALTCCVAINEATGWSTSPSSGIEVVLIERVQRDQPTDRALRIGRNGEDALDRGVGGRFGLVVEMDRALDRGARKQRTVVVGSQAAGLAADNHLFGMMSGDPRQRLDPQRGASARSWPSVGSAGGSEIRKRRISRATSRRSEPSLTPPLRCAAALALRRAG